MKNKEFKRLCNWYEWHTKHIHGQHISTSAFEIARDKIYEFEKQKEILQL